MAAQTHTDDFIQTKRDGSNWSLIAQWHLIVSLVSKHEPPNYNTFRLTVYIFARITCVSIFILQSYDETAMFEFGIPWNISNYMEPEPNVD
jgi:hypothetical protein